MICVHITSREWKRQIFKPHMLTCLCGKTMPRGRTGICEVSLYQSLFSHFSEISNKLIKIEMISVNTLSCECMFECSFEQLKNNCAHKVWIVPKTLVHIQPKHNDKYRNNWHCLARTALSSASPGMGRQWLALTCQLNVMICLESPTGHTLY